MEFHSARGYLLHGFLSPLSNFRDDCFGGSFENRTLILREVVQAIRQVWPSGYPLFVRISSCDWGDGGWTLDDSMALATQLKALGIDLIDCSSGGAMPSAPTLTGAGLQVPFAERIPATRVFSPPR